MTARETLVTTLTNLLALSRRGRMGSHRAEAERLVDDVLHEAADALRGVPGSDVGNDWDWWDAATIPGKCADVIDPRTPAPDFDALLRASEQRAEAKRTARVYPYDLEVGQ